MVPLRTKQLKGRGTILIPDLLWHSKGKARLALRHDALAQEFYMAPHHEDDVHLSKVAMADCCLAVFRRWLCS